MKAILEFTLPEDREEFRMAVDSANYSCLLNEFGNYLRSIVKHGGGKDDKEIEVYEEVYRKFNTICSDYNIEWM